jgi:hypothetical protein
VVETAAGVTSLAQSFEEHGRDPATLIVRTSLPIVRDADGEPDFAESFASLAAHRDAGITDVTVWSNTFIDSHDHATERIASLGSAWSRARWSLREVASP